MIKTILGSTTFRWLLAIIITLASAVYQRTTGPTYPLKGEVQIEGSSIQYELNRSYSTNKNQPVEVQVPSSSINGTLKYRRYPTSEQWTEVKMNRLGDLLINEIPSQPPAGKMEYYIDLKTSSGIEKKIPENENVITRFKGDVPASVLAPHILFMFLAMLLSTRTGIEALDKSSNPRKFAFWTFGLLTIGGMILGPIMQKFAFDALWTGVPFGWDLTDNKTLIAFLVWLVAIWKGRNQQNSNGWIFAAAIVTLVIFIIPHSLMGSELKYG